MSQTVFERVDAGAVSYRTVGTSNGQKFYYQDRGNKRTIYEVEIMSLLNRGLVTEIPGRYFGSGQIKSLVR